MIQISKRHVDMLLSGEQKYLASVDKLPESKPIPVFQDDKQVGVIVLADTPAQMIKDEFTLDRWFEKHKVTHKERKDWWGDDAQVFYVYNVLEYAEKQEDKFQPPKAAQENAQRVLRWREEHPEEIRGMTRVGWTRAQQLASGEPISLDIVKRMAQFNRHRDNAEIAPEHRGTPWKDAGYVAFLGWGGVQGIDWAIRIAEREAEKSAGEDKQMPYEVIEQEEEFCVRKIEDGEMIGCHESAEMAQAQITALNIAESEEEEKKEEKPEQVFFKTDQLEAQLEKALSQIEALQEKLQSLEKEDKSEHTSEEMEEVEEEKQEGFDDSEWSGAASNWPDTTSYCSDCLIDINPEGEDKVQRLCLLPYRKPGSDIPNVNALRTMASGRGITAIRKPDGVSQSDYDSQRRQAAQWIADQWPKAFEDREVPESIMDIAKGKKAGRRLRESIADQLRGMMDTLKEIIVWANYEDNDDEMEEMPMAGGFMEFVKGETSFNLFKSADGRDLLIAHSTNAFRDRDLEYFSTRGLEAYVAEANQTGERGKFNFWHIPGTDFATKVWQGVQGRVLVEIAEFDDTPMGKAALEFFRNYPSGHPNIAGKSPWGCSPEFIYLPSERKAGVYDNFQILRTSVLPRSKAANIWTKAEVVKMAVNKEQREALAEMVGGEEAAEQILQGADAQTKELEQAGITFKEEKQEGECINCACEQKQEKEVETPNVDYEALGAVLVKHFGVEIEPILEKMGTLEEALEGIANRVKNLEGQEEIKKEVDTPRMVLSLQKRASQSNETVVEKDDPLLKMKPKEAKTEGTGASNFFGPK